jgi:hypothetical protein
VKAKTQVIHERSSQWSIVGQQPSDIFHQIKHHRDHAENTHHEKKRSEEFSDDVPIDAVEQQL